MKISTVNLVYLVCIFLALTISSCKKDPVSGCTNPKAENYDPKADTESGNCIIKGCTNPKAENYDPDATVETGFCLIKGCTNPLAENYDAEANVDNGSCIIKGCTDPNALNYNQAANTDDGSCYFENAKFIGTYKGKLTCMNAIIVNFIGTPELTFVFEEIPGVTNKVKMRLENSLFGNQDLEGEINGNKLSYTAIEQTIMIDTNMDGTPDQNVTIKNSGEFTSSFPAPNLDGIIHMAIKTTFNGLPISLEDDCTMMAIKQ